MNLTYKKSFWYLIIAILLSACASKKKELVGKWNYLEDGEKNIIEFKEDGTFDFEVGPNGNWDIAEEKMFDKTSYLILQYPISRFTSFKIKWFDTVSIGLETSEGKNAVLYK